MRKKILLLTDFYEPKPSANGVCIKKISYELINLGYEVHVVCYGLRNEKLYEQINEVNVHRVLCPNFYQIREKCNSNNLYKSIFFIARIKRYLRILLHFYSYPLIYPNFAKKYYDKVKSVIEIEKIETIIAEYLPIEAAYAAIKLKQDKPNLTVKAYVVDTFTQGVNEIKHPHFGKTSLNWENKLLDSCDDFFCLTNFKNYYTNNKYKDKIKFVGLPLIDNSIVDKDANVNKNITLMYTGSWGGERDPLGIMNAIDVLNKSGKNIIFIYCGKNTELANSLEKKYCFFKNYGFLDEYQIKNLAKRVDCLVNIGNSTNMLPSKLFSYFAFGLPIIHFYLDKNDPCMEFLRQYPASKIFELDKFTPDEIYEGIENIRTKTLSYSEISNLYKEFTVEFITKSLINY